MTIPESNRNDQVAGTLTPVRRYRRNDFPTPTSHKNGLAIARIAGTKVNFLETTTCV